MHEEKDSGNSMSAPQLHLDFAHDWQAEILERRPLIAPSRQFVYPQQVEEVERGALEVLVRPPANPPFLGTFALGFADSVVPSGVWSCPDPAWFCAVAGGYAYMVDGAHPERWTQIAYRPVLLVRALLQQRLLLFAGHHSLLAWGRDGKAWETARLSWEGVKILDVNGSLLTGLGWDLMADREFEFQIDLRTGERAGIGSRE